MVDGGKPLLDRQADCPQCEDESEVKVPCNRSGTERVDVVNYVQLPKCAMLGRSIFTKLFSIIEGLLSIMQK